MGQYHYLVNLDKRQFVSPYQIGNGMKLCEQFGWTYATATVLVMLLAASSRDGGRGNGDFRSSHPLIGSWAGDRIAFIGDLARSEDVPGVNAALVYQQCSAVRHANITQLKPCGWETWRNISPQVQEMMADEFGIRYEGEDWLQIIEPHGRSVHIPLNPALLVAQV